MMTDPAAPATATAALRPQLPGGTRRRRGLRRWLREIAVICLSAAVVAIVAGALGITQLNTARRVLLDQLDPALLGMHTLSTALINRETGVRGFAATGNRDFLAPHQQGRQQEDAALVALRRLGAAQPRPELTTGLDEALARARSWPAPRPGTPLPPPRVPCRWSS